ncbi:MAG TPA: condensation domain-containing protein, partial [Pilimelia sp.]|nr:condensation domain-containing protein [Pilimelia sp.]
MTQPATGQVTARERLLARMLAERGYAAEVPPAIPRRPSDVDVPLSPAQRRLWYLDRLDGGSAYVMSAVYRLTGPLRADALAESLAHVVRRHEALRTSFRTRDGAPVQVVDPAAAPVLSRHDVSGHPVDAREAAAAAIARAET